MVRALKAAVSSVRGGLKRFLSLSFDQPIGPRVERERLAGYYIDMRVKAPSPEWPPPWLLPLDDQLCAVIAQWGLGAYEHYLETGGEQWLAAAAATGEHLIERQQRSGPLAGGFVHQRAFPHSFRLDPPWLSAMAQGEAASLLLRIHAENGDDRFAEAARMGVRPYMEPSTEGGVRTALGSGPFFEEYPTDPPSLVLNGGIFALWGLHDVGLALGDSEARGLFADGVDALAAGIDRWDLGYWSRYDLYPHPIVNVASPAYHRLHTDQLTVMGQLAPRPQLAAAEERFRSYTARAVNRARAFAAKVAFRVRVPR